MMKWNLLSLSTNDADIRVRYSSRVFFLVRTTVVPLVVAALAVDIFCVDNPAILPSFRTLQSGQQVISEVKKKPKQWQLTAWEREGSRMSLVDPMCPPLSQLWHRRIQRKQSTTGVHAQKVQSRGWTRQHRCLLIANRLWPNQRY